VQLWFSEDQTRHIRISVRIKAVLHRETTPYQEVMILDTVELGRMLVLDDIIQVTEHDEFCYHEMMSHVPAFTHPRPRRALVVGGGDGGCVRELLKHPTIEQVDLCEIDEAVVRACRQYLPEVAAGLDDPRCRILIQDGIAYVKDCRDHYDVVVVDSTDPIGPAVGLFDEAFYRAAARALTADGVFVAQTESPFFFQDILLRARRNAEASFAHAALYWGVVPTYPGGFWTYTMGSKTVDPARPDPEALARRAAAVKTRYWSPEVHRQAFVLPPFVRDLVAR